MFKKIALTALIGAALISAAGCGGSDKKADSSAASGAKKVTIGFSVSTQNNPFFVTMANSVKAAAEKAGVNVKIVDAQNDPAKQSNDIADLLQGNISVLIVNPVDSAAVSNSVLAANKAKIPVITIDRASDKGEVAVHIASNNIKGGEMAAEYIVSKLGEGTPVAELEGIPGASASRERGQGFHNIADKKLKVLAKQSANFDRSQGLTVSENILQAAANKQIFIIGFDGTDDGVKAVKDGTMAATIAQQPDKMGEIGVDAALKLAKGENVEKNIAVDLKLIENK